MGGFLDSFVRQASITKLDQNNRDMKAMGEGVGQLVAEAVKQQQSMDQMADEIRELNQEVADWEISLDQWIAHHAAQKAQSQYLMSELDKACGGAENNPARMHAYDDSDALRIPSGDRKGGVMTKADHFYISAFADKFKERFAKK